MAGWPKSSRKASGFPVLPSSTSNPLRDLRAGRTTAQGAQGHLQSLESLGHDPSDRARATELARAYGTKLYTGVLYRNPNPPRPRQGVTERQQALQSQAVPRHEMLNRFKPTH